MDGALDSFLAKYVLARQLRSAKKIARCFSKYIRPTLGKMSIREVGRADIVDLLDRIAEDHGPVMSDRVLSRLRKAFGWYAIRDKKFIVPIIRGMARSSPTAHARRRILTDDEIRVLWDLTVDSVRHDFNTVVRILLLTAQRGSEFAKLRWADIRRGVWIIPAAHSKNGMSHTVQSSAVSANKRLFSLIE